MKHNSMKLRITNLIQRQTAVQNIVQSTAQNRETNIQKTENPALNLQSERKTSSRDTYMFVSQKNKIIEDVFPDGDVLHIKKCTGGAAHGSI